MKPSNVTYELEINRAGQRVTLEHTAFNNQWVIVQHASNQLQATQRIEISELLAAVIMQGLG